MNEVKITEERLMDLLMVERSFKEVLEHLYQSRDVNNVHGEGRKYKVVQYNLNTEKVDEILKQSIKGFREEITNE